MARQRQVVDNAQLHDIVRMLPDVLFRCVKGEDGRIYWTLNEGGLAEEFGLTTEKIQGVPLEELFPGGASDAIREEFEAAFRGETRQWTNEMNGRHFRHFPQPIFDGDGNVEAVIGFISDVTELVEKEQQLQGAFNELESFTHAVSHDLKLPIMAMQNLLRVVKHSDKATQAQAIDRLESSLSRMEGMLESLLALSKVGQGGIRRQNADATAIAKDVVHTLLAKEPGRAVRINVQENMNFHADQRLVQTALENLIGNAWKHVPEGGTIEVRQQEEDEDWLEVKDDGDGFDNANSAALFEPFSQLDEAQEGHGLGLATVLRVARAHGGQVRAHGVPGEGATFGVSFGGSR